MASTTTTTTTSGGAGAGGNSSGSSGLGQPPVFVDQRKRKRMDSNRESARRSRMRKQKLLTELTGQATRLMKENSQILTGINITAQHLVNVEAENSVLRAQTAELSQRLQSLDEIINFIYATNGVSETEGDDGFVNPMNMLCFNHPIMATGAGDAPLFHY